MTFNRTSIAKTIVAAATAAAIALPAQAPAATIAKPVNAISLAAHWTFNDETGTVATDVSGNGKHATLGCVGSGCAVPTWVAAKRGGGIDSVSNAGGTVYGRVDAPSTVASATNNVITVSAWYYNKGGGGDSRIVNRGWCSSMGWLMHEGYGFGVNNSTGCLAQYWASFGGLSTGRWYHLVGTFDGVTVRSYKDGVLVNSVGTSGVNLAANNYGIEMMTANNGKLDDVRIYNRAFSAAEVTALYRSGETVRKLATANGLVGYWPMNDGSGTQMSDLSGAGSNGTLTGGPTWVQGKRGQALSFDGIDDWVNGIAPVVPSPTNAFTASGWINPDNQYARFLTPSANGVDNSVNYDATNQRLEVLFTEIADVNNRTLYSAVGSVPLNRWTHWAVSINDKNVKIYINGVLNAESNESINIGSWNGGVWYVGQRGTSAFWLKGKLDDLRVYNRVLSAAEVKAVYSASETVANAPQNDRLTSGLAGYWTFNGRDVTTSVADVAGSNNGYLYNAATSSMLAIGKVGQGVQHNGSSSYFKAGGQSALGTVNQAYSISVWANIDPTETSGNIVHVSAGSDGQSWCLPMINLNAGKISAISWTGAASRAADPATATTGDWHHIVHTWSASGGLTLYVDGVQVANTAQGTFSASGSANYVFTGFSPSSCTDDRGYFNGKTDELRVYSRALTAAEAKRLYLMGK